MEQNKQQNKMFHLIWAIIYIHYGIKKEKWFINKCWNSLTQWTK